ncbi:hypothetical protein Hanom_Chr02g00150911 [Helianthus anomalus]
MLILGLLIDCLKAVMVNFNVSEWNRAKMRRETEIEAVSQTWRRPFSSTCSGSSIVFMSSLALKFKISHHMKFICYSIFSLLACKCVYLQIRVFVLYVVTVVVCSLNIKLETLIRRMVSIQISPILIMYLITFYIMCFVFEFWIMDKHTIFIKDLNYNWF